MASFSNWGRVFWSDAARRFDSASRAWLLALSPLVLQDAGGVALLHELQRFARRAEQGGRIGGLRELVRAVHGVHLVHQAEHLEDLPVLAGRLGEQAPGQGLPVLLAGVVAHQVGRGLGDARRVLQLGIGALQDQQPVFLGLLPGGLGHRRRFLHVVRGFAEVVAEVGGLAHEPEHDRDPGCRWPPASACRTRPDLARSLGSVWR